MLSLAIRRLIKFNWFEFDFSASMRAPFAIASGEIIAADVAWHVSDAAQRELNRAALLGVSNYTVCLVMFCYVSRSNCELCVCVCACLYAWESVHIRTIQKLLGFHFAAIPMRIWRRKVWIGIWWSFGQSLRLLLSRTIWWKLVVFPFQLWKWRADHPTYKLHILSNMHDSRNASPPTCWITNNIN